MGEVTNLRSYHLPGEEGDVITPVTPIRAPRLRAVYLSERDVEVLEVVGEGLNRLGCDSGQVLVEVAKAWRLGQ